MDVIVLTANSDNYMYILIDKAANTAAAIDPFDYRKIIKTVETHKINLTHILTTHHHWDHADGNDGLVSYKPTIIVCGGDNRINSVSQIVENGTKIKVGSIVVDCIKTPGHTSNHICYYATHVQHQDSPCIFTGDTLFIGGCGRLFEGTPLDMYKSLVEKISRLPLNTLVYCGHEYTVKNLKFGLTIDPNNKFIRSKLNWAMEKIANNLPTVPSTIGEELEYNVFMRVSNCDYLKKCGCVSSVDLMGYLRELKNKF